jgi:hypothetical protein
MELKTANRDAVLTCLGLATEPAAASTATGIDEPAMDRPERWRRERREDDRV